MAVHGFVLRTSPAVKLNIEPPALCPFLGSSFHSGVYMKRSVRGHASLFVGSRSTLRFNRTFVGQSGLPKGFVDRAIGVNSIGGLTLDVFFAVFDYDAFV